MQIARVVIAAIIAAPVGAVAGKFLADQQSAAVLSTVANEKNALAASLEEMTKAAKLAKERSDSMQRELARLQDEIEYLREEKSKTAAALEATQFEPELTAEAEAVNAAPADREGERGGRGEWGGDDNDPERAERMARWREEREQRGNEWRERISNFMNEQIQNAPDKASQERLAAINEYTQYTMDLFRQMREAQTDEERDLIRQELQAIGETTRQLVREQQDSVIKQNLQRSGITDARSQEAAVAAMREAMESPFFRMPMGGGWGGPGGGPWRGRGGDGGGSRTPPAQ